MYELTTVLRSKVDDIENMIDQDTKDTLKQQTHHAWQLLQQHQEEFTTYVNNMEAKFQDMKSMLSNATMTKTSVEKFNTLREQLLDTFGEFLPTISAPQLDILSATRHLLNEFTQQVKDTTAKGSSLMNEQPWLQLVPNILNDRIDDMVERVTGIDKHINTTNKQGYYSGDRRSGNAMEFGNQSPGSREFHGLHAYLPRWPLAVFMCTAMCCLLFSAIFHLFNAVSQRTALLLQALDYCGISILITGSNIPVIYYGFYCAPMLRHLYVTLITVMGFTVFMITILPRFRPVKYRELKTILFIGLGVSGAIPLTHLMFHFGRVHFIFWYLIAMGVFYLVGAAIYLTRIPERFSPGKFDIWFSSHQLWHMLIFIAVLTLYTGLIHFYEWRMYKVCVAH